MIADFAEISAAARYHWLTQAVIPRPIAWALSENDDGSHNLAPFFCFNAMSSAPPLIGVSFGARPDGGGDKDTLKNIRRRGFFVAHIAPMRLLRAVNDSSASLPYGDSEVSRLGLKTTPLAADFPLPRLEAAPVALACRKHREISLGAAQTLILGEVLFLFADDAVMRADEKGRRRIDAKKTDPVARLSAGRYAGLTEEVELPRPA